MHWELNKQKQTCDCVDTKMHDTDNSDWLHNKTIIIYVNI